jgi:branched-subunit amino acid transport protein AzlD
MYKLDQLIRTPAGLHLWRRNAMLSILGGTAVHVALLTTLDLSVQ